MIVICKCRNGQTAPHTHLSFNCFRSALPALELAMLNKESELT
jgi:hypothetical protein